MHIIISNRICQASAPKTHCSGRHCPGQTRVRNSATLTEGDSAPPSHHHPLPKSDSRAGTRSQVLESHWLFISLINAISFLLLKKEKRIGDGSLTLSPLFMQKRFAELTSYFTATVCFTFSCTLTPVMLMVAVGTILLIHGLSQAVLLLHTHTHPCAHAATISDNIWKLGSRSMQAF